MKIAIVKLSSLGDIVHAMVALQFIKAALPAIEIDWIVEERFAEILKYNPDIDHILSVNLKAVKENRASLVEQLKTIRSYAQNRYDLVIDAQGLLKSAVTSKLLGSHAAGFDADSVRERIASLFYNTKIACPYDANTIVRNAAVMTQPLGFTLTDEQLAKKKSFLFFHGEDERLSVYLNEHLKNIVFVVGSTWESRSYPIEKYLKIADELQQNGLVIWASPEERRKAEWLSEQSNWVQIIPRLDLNNLKALIAKADLVIGNDTGPTHMAWALNRPSITIFGPTPVSRVQQTDINKVVKSASIVNPHKLNKQDFSIRDLDEQLIIDLAKPLLAMQHQATHAHAVEFVNAASLSAVPCSIDDSEIEELANALLAVDTDELFADDYFK